MEKKKTIAIMLDIGGTSSRINKKTAEVLVKQLEFLRVKFGANYATISISTLYDDSECIDEVLNVIAPFLTETVKIGINFNYVGTYDYEKHSINFIDYGFNTERKKISNFEEYVINNQETENVWFGVFDDSFFGDEFLKYRDNHLMLVGKPSTFESDTLNNCFMNIATTTQNIDGVIEIIDTYINSIKDLSLEEIKSTQINMKCRIPKIMVIHKIKQRDFAFLKQYLNDGLAKVEEYNAFITALKAVILETSPSTTEAFIIKDILELVSLGYERTNQLDMSKNILILRDDIISKYDLLGD